MSPRDARWVLRRCARVGHILAYLDDPGIAARFGPLPCGPEAPELLRCLRCGQWLDGRDPLVGETMGTSLAPVGLADLPLPARSPHGRRFGLLRVIAVERWIRGLLMFVAGLAAFHVAQDRGSILARFEQLVVAARPLGEQLGLHITDWRLVRAAEEYLGGNGDPVRLAGVFLVLYGALELVEGVGLWGGWRWVEYFSAVVTAAFVPLEVYELLHRPTALKAVALVANLVIVAYLVYKGWLFGVRGGHPQFLAEVRDSTLPADALRSLGRSPAELSGARVV